MGGGVSTPSEAQGIETRTGVRRLLPSLGFKETSHFKFADIQCSILRDSLHDADLASDCIRSINEAMNEKVETKDSQQLREELCGCGLDGLVVNLMTSFADHEECIRECVVAVGSLCYRSEARKVRLVDHGVASALVDAVHRHVDSIQVQEEALWALGNLSAGPERIKAKLVDMHLGPTALRSMRTHGGNVVVQKTGLICIGNLGNKQEARCRKLCADGGAAGACCAALRAHAMNTEVQAYGFYAAATLTEGNFVFCGDALVAAGIWERLLFALDTHRGVRTVQQYVCKFAAVLVAGSLAADRAQQKARGGGGGGGTAGAEGAEKRPAAPPRASDFRFGLPSRRSAGGREAAAAASPAASLSPSSLPCPPLSPCAALLQQEGQDLYRLVGQVKAAHEGGGKGSAVLKYSTQVLFLLDSFYRAAVEREGTATDSTPTGGGGGGGGLGFGLGRGREGRKEKAGGEGGSRGGGGGRSAFAAALASRGQSLGRGVRRGGGGGGAGEAAGKAVGEAASRGTSAPR